MAGLADELLAAALRYAQDRLEDLRDQAIGEIEAFLQALGVPAAPLTPAQADEVRGHLAAARAALDALPNHVADLRIVQALDAVATALSRTQAALDVVTAAVPGARDLTALLRGVVPAGPTSGLARQLGLPSVAPEGLSVTGGAVVLTLPAGAGTTLSEGPATLTIGRSELTVRATTPGWRMFETDGLPGLLAPPAAVHVLEGPELEDVLFLRDEVANLVWAVERTVTGPSGDPHARATEPPPVPATGGPVVERAELDWVLQTTTPAHWFPYLPTSDGYREVGLRRARVSGQQPPAGRLVAEEAQRHLFDGEVPRDGVRVRRVPVVARRADGTYERWVTRRVSTGRGEGWSGLAFDGAVRRTGG